jgi:Cu+-exporting ATPase
VHKLCIVIERKFNVKGVVIAEREITMKIEGMTRASCVAHIEEGLGGLNGVLRASVNFATEKATVEFLPGVVDVAAMRRAVMPRVTLYTGVK